MGAARHDDRPVVHNQELKQDIEPDHDQVQSAKCKDLLVNLPYALSHDPLGQPGYSKQERRANGCDPEPICDLIPKHVDAERFKDESV